VTPRSPQLALRLDAAAPPDPLAPWRDGAAIPYHGGTLTLRLSTGNETASRRGDELRLALPPEASPRQVRDSAEAWLRDAATKLVGETLAGEAARRGRPVPPWRLSFAARGDWAGSDGDGLRIRWRLVEQPPAVIAQVLGRALAALPQAAPGGDLFAMLTA